MAPSQEVADAVERLWHSNRPKILTRLRQVVSAVEQLACGGEVDRAEAQRQAHALAGALGTYRRPGSPLLKEVEQALASPEDDRPGMARRAEQLQALLTALAGPATSCSSSSRPGPELG